MTGEAGSRGGGGWFTAVLAVAAVALSVLVVLLALQNRDLKRELADVHGEGDRPQLEIGDAVDPLAVFDDAGGTHTLDWTVTRRTVVVAYTTTCPACAETRPRWDALAQRITGLGSVRMLGLELDRPRPGSGTPTATPAATGRFPVYGIERDANRPFLDLVPFVPATIVIDARGTVVDVRFGILEDDDVDEVVAALEP